MEVQAQLGVLSQSWLQFEPLLVMNRVISDLGKSEERGNIGPRVCAVGNGLTSRGECKENIMSSFTIVFVIQLYVYGTLETLRERRTCLPPHPQSCEITRDALCHYWIKIDLRDFVEAPLLLTTVYDDCIILWLIHFCHRNINLKLILFYIYRLNSCH